MFKRPRLTDLLGVLLTLVLLYSHGQLLADPGIGWHLKAGEWMFQNGKIPRVDPFLLAGPSLLAGAGPHVWIHDQWLSDVLLYSLYRSGGWLGLELFVCVCCIGSLIFVLTPFLRRYTTSGVLVFGVVALCAFVQSVQWFVRPVVLSLLLFAWVYQLSCRWFEEEQLGKKQFVALPFVFLVWANLHPAFVLGLFVLFAAITMRHVRTPGRGDRRFVAAAICSACATLVTPWGVNLYASMIGLAGSSYFTKLNQEWLSPDLQAAGFFGATLLLGLLLLLQYRERGRPLHVFDLLLVGLFLFLSLLQRRYLPYFAIVSAAPLVKLVAGESGRAEGRTHSALIGLFRRLSEHEAESPGGFWTGTIWVAAALVLVTTKSLPFAHPEWDARFMMLPPAMHNALAAAEPAPIFQSPDLGGVITWSLWPKQRAWIDDRNQVIGVAPYEAWFKAARGEPGWRQLFEEQRFRWVLAESRSALRAVLESDVHWRKIADSPEFGIMLFERMG